jgi:hypothetical protein
VDDRDRAAYAAAFVPEGRLTVYVPGADAPVAEYRGSGLAGVIDFVLRYEATLHFVGNHVCELDGDSASGQTYCLAHHLRRDGTTLLLVARYRDAYVRTAAGWRFLSRDCRLLWKENST